MKKVFLFILLVILFAGTNAQSPFPINQSLGGPTTLVTSKGGLTASVAFILPNYTDTTAANVSPYPKNYPGSLIYTTGDTKIWYRNTTATEWLEVGSGSSGVNIYNSNGTLTSNRQLNGDGLDLRFANLSEFGAYADDVILSNTAETQQIFIDNDSVAVIGTNFNVNANTNLRKAVSFSGTITPDQITGNVDNYNPPGLDSASVIRISADGAYNITGLDGGTEGRIVILHNIGTETITLTSEDGDSDSENQFLFSSNVSLAANTSILLQYDGTSEKWRDATNYGGQSLLFARTDARNETGSAMYFSAAGQSFTIDSVGEYEITSFFGDDEARFQFSTEAIVMRNLNVATGVQSQVRTGPGFSIITVVSSGFESEITVNDSILIKPHLGNFHIDTLNHIPNPGTYKMMVWDSATGHVGTRLLPTGSNPGGSNDQVQVNVSGAFGAYGSFTFIDADDVATLTVGESGGSRGAVVFQNASNSYTLMAPGSGTNILELPTNAGTSGQVLTRGSGNTTSWEDAATGTGITIGTTTITSGTSGRVLYNNSSVVGEMTTSGTGTELALTASPTFTGTPAAPTATAGTHTTQLATTAFATDAGTPQQILVNNALGGNWKATVTGIDIQNSAAATGLVDGQARYMPVYLNQAQTLTGVTVFIRTQGNYTGDNNNKVALYSYSGGTMTKVAESSNSSTLWSTASANTYQNIAFSSTYAAAAGTYFIAFLYNSSSQTTAPALAGQTISQSQMGEQGFSNSAKLYTAINAQTDLPSTQAMSGVASQTTTIWAALY